MCTHNTGFVTCFLAQPNLCTTWSNAALVRGTGNWNIMFEEGMCLVLRGQEGRKGKEVTVIRILWYRVRTWCDLNVERKERLIRDQYAPHFLPFRFISQWWWTLTSCPSPSSHARVFYYGIQIQNQSSLRCWCIVRLVLGNCAIISLVDHDRFK